MFVELTGIMDVNVILVREGALSLFVETVSRDARHSRFQVRFVALLFAPRSVARFDKHDIPVD